MPTRRSRILFYLLGCMTGYLISLVSLQLRSALLVTSERTQTPADFSGDLLERELKLQMDNKEQVSPVQVFNDSHLHEDADDTTVADQLFQQIRILCLVFTYEKNFQTKATSVNATWGQRCSKLLFVTNQEFPSLPTLVVSVSDGRQFLSEKTRQAFNYAYDNYLDDYDWFMKADDDTYVVMENLRYFLSEHNPNEALYFGQHFLVLTKKQGYTSGGAGYVISREAMKRYGEKSETMCKFEMKAEDVSFGRCMEELEIAIRDSLDSLGRTRFHCFSPKVHLYGRFDKWFYQYDKYKGKKKVMYTRYDFIRQ